MAKPTSEPCDVLIIDDDEEFSEVISLTLMENGLKPKLIHNPLQVEPQLGGINPKAILLDVRMPEINGIELMTNIRKTYNAVDLPIIMITGYDDIELAEIFEKGANAFISKPVSDEELMAKVDMVMGVRNTHKIHLNETKREALKAIVATHYHEINNPLTIAMGNVDILLRKKEYDEERLRKAQNSIMRVHLLLEELCETAENENTEINFETDDGLTKLRRVPKDNG